jgi:SNF family Na+-dependent transporter
MGYRESAKNCHVLFEWPLTKSSQVFSVLFFLMLITLGLGSATGLISSVVGIVCDEKRHWNKTFVTFVICLAGFGLGLIYITPVRSFKLSSNK